MSEPNAEARWRQGERPGSALSRQQQEIYSLTLAGWSSSRIASSLGVTKSSVDQQRLRIAAKLGVSKAQRREARQTHVSALLLTQRERAA